MQRKKSFGISESMQYLFLLAFVLGSFTSFAAEDLEEETLEIKKSVSSPSPFIATVDIRPTASFKGQDSFRFENSFDLGYQLSPQSMVLYHQDYWMNLYNSRLVGGADGLGLIAQDGFFDWTYNNFFKNSDESLTLSYEGRLYLPTFSNRREAGMLTAVRNYIILGTKISSALNLNLIEAAIIHAYDRPEHKNQANPFLENRVTVQLVWNMSEKWQLSFPVAWSVTRMRTAEGAQFSNINKNFAWVNPELRYSLSPNYRLGLGYYDTTSLIRSDFSAFQIGEGLEDGVAQVFLQASL